MTRHVRHLIAALLAAAVLLPAGSALADPVSDCASDGALNGSYSDSELRAALGNIPADLDEYSDCRAAISGAIGGGGPTAKSSGASPGAGGGGAATAVTAKKQKAAKAKAREKAKKAKKIRQIAAVAPGADNGGAALQAADTSSGMPTGLLLALIALGLLAIAGGVMTLSRRVPAVGEALRRVTPGRSQR
jgi:hypothetical protein